MIVEFPALRPWKWQRVEATLKQKERECPGGRPRRSFSEGVGVGRGQGSGVGTCFRRRRGSLPADASSETGAREPAGATPNGILISLQRGVISLTSSALLTRPTRRVGHDSRLRFHVWDTNLRAACQRCCPQTCHSRQMSLLREVTSTA